MPWGVRDAALLCACGFGALALSVAAAQGFYLLEGTPRSVPSQPPAALATVTANLFYLVILMGVWLLVVRRYAVPWSVLGLRWPRRATLAPLLVLSALFVIGSALIVTAATWVLGLAGSRAGVVPEIVLGGGPERADRLFPIILIGSLLLAPLAEEFLWRGVLYQALRKHMGAILAATASALVFTLLHLGPALAFETFWLGVVLAVAFEQTRSLYPSMLLHAAYNGAIIVLTLRGAA